MGALAAAAGAATWVVSSQLVDGRPDPKGDERERVALASHGLIGESIRIPAPDGLILHGTLLQPAGPPRCGVVLLHGRGGGRYGLHSYVSVFLDAGCVVLTQGVRGLDVEPTMPTYGRLEVGDVSRALDILKDSTSLTDDRLGVFGLSYGGTLALKAVAARPVGFVITDSAFSDLPLAIEDLLERNGVAWASPLAQGVLALTAFRTGQPMTKTRARTTDGIPSLVIHAAADGRLGADHARRICVTAECTLWLTDANGHVRSQRHDPETYRTRVHQLLDRALGAVQ